MPELIWYKRFPQDWMSDPQLGRCSPATRGIWADIIECCYLTNSAWLVGPTEELARVCRCSEKDFEGAVAELKKHKVGEFQGTEAQHKIGCRRIIRMLSLKDLKRKAGLVSAAQRQHTTQHNPQQTGPTDWSTRSASASVSASVSASENASESERGESKGGIEYEEVKSTPHEGAAISHDGAALPQAGDQEWNGMNGMNMSLPLHMPEARPKAPSLTPQQARLKLLFRTKASPFSDNEVKAWKRMPPIDEQELTAIERYYRMKERGGQKLYKMKSLTTLLNRWDEAVDWALNFKETSPL